MQLGKNSPKLVRLRKAIRHGTLTDDGLLPIEGPILLEEAERSRIEIVDVFVRHGTAVPISAHDHFYEVEPDVFKSIQETEHSQGIVATVRMPQLSLDEVLAAPRPLIVVLCRLQDPGNAGTIFRVGEAFGATACIASQGTVSFHNSKVVRASAGSVFRLPHVGDVDLRQLAIALRARDIKIVGTALTSESSIEKWDWRNPTAVLIGNEGSGLHAEELAYCDTVLRIPHKTTVESLNSAIATSVILYEALKQRR